MAWIIGWDLILEYAVGNIAGGLELGRATSSSCAGLSLFILKLPLWAVADLKTAHALIAQGWRWRPAAASFDRPAESLLWP